MDSHNCRRLAINGRAENEGDVQVGGFPPYPISYRSIIPKRLSHPASLASSRQRTSPVTIFSDQSSRTSTCLHPTKLYFSVIRWSSSLQIGAKNFRRRKSSSGSKSRNCLQSFQSTTRLRGRALLVQNERLPAAMSTRRSRHRHRSCKAPLKSAGRSISISNRRRQSRSRRSTVSSPSIPQRSIQLKCNR